MSADLTPSSGTKPGWILTPEAFDRLLAALDKDRDRSALVYEQLRQRLEGLFQWWGATAAADLADETLDRMARKLEEGVVIAEGSIGAYARGVARMIFYESSRRPRPHGDDVPDVAAPIADESTAPIECFDRCLEALSSEDRTLVLRYYDEGKAKDVRRRLADELCVTLTALRIRVHRLRERLERCVAACAAGEEERRET